MKYKPHPNIEITKVAQAPDAPCTPMFCTLFRNSIPGFGYKKTGFTVIELLITIAIVAVLVTLAEPSYSTFIEKRKITGGAEEIASFMMLARSEAVKHNQQTTVSFVHTSDTDWCLGMVLGGTACNCKTTPDSCVLAYTENDGTAVSEPRLISSSDYSGFNSTTATTGSGDTALTYDPVRGILADSTDDFLFTLQSDNTDYELTINVSVTGTVKTCTNSSKKVSGYKSCL